MSTIARPASQQILLVEDERIVALEEKRVLESAGYAVHVARSGEEALEAVGDHQQINLVLMDINLDGAMDGTVAAVEILRRHDLPIMFLSSHTEPEIVEKTEGITSYGYIVKNTGETILLASIRMAFRLHEARMQVKAQSRVQRALLDVSRDLAATHDLQAIMQTASDRLSEIAGLDAGAIYLVDGQSLILRATTPALPLDFPDEFRVAPLNDHSHIKRAIETESPVYVHDTRVEPFTPAEKAVVDSRGLRSISYVPLVSQARAIGVYIAGSTTSNVVLDSTTSDLCVTLANMAAVAAENALLMETSRGAAEC